MGCDCCKEVNPADYENCQQDMERILRNKEPTYLPKDMSLFVVSHSHLVQSLQCPRRRGNIKDKQYDEFREVNLIED